MQSYRSLFLNSSHASNITNRNEHIKNRFVFVERIFTSCHTIQRGSHHPAVQLQKRLMDSSLKMRLKLLCKKVGMSSYYDQLLRFL